MGEVIGVVLSAALEIAFRVAVAPWRALLSRARRPDGLRQSLPTRFAAVVVVLQAVPLIGLLLFVDVLLWRLATDDLLMFIGPVIFLPAAALLTALAAALAGGAVLAALALREGNRVARGMVVGLSSALVVVGAALSNLEPSLGYAVALLGGLEVVLLVLPAAAADFAPRAEPAQPTDWRQ